MLLFNYIQITLFDFHSRATNNCGEIEAVTEAIKIARDNGISRLNIILDSEFTKNCIEKWMPNWRNNNWRKANGEEVKNM